MSNESRTATTPERTESLRVKANTPARSLDLETVPTWMIDRLTAWTRVAHLQRCESPLERALLEAFLHGEDRFCVSLACTPRAAAGGFETGSWVDGSFDCIDLFVQHELRIEERSVRLDFALVGRGVRLAIEVDGHDFHERTKEQAERDRSRDRALQRAGWTVLRFTGREVNRDAARCVAEVLDGVRSALGDTSR